MEIEAACECTRSRRRQWLRTRLHARLLALVVEERAELGLVLVVQLLEVVVVEGVHLVGMCGGLRGRLSRERVRAIQLAVVSRVSGLLSGVYDGDR